jgi:hypothetical protein
MANLIVSAVAKWNGSALKKGQKDLTSFQKTTLALGKAFAAAFAVRRITQFGKASVAAFAADEKAAKSLAVALQNTGNGFATIATEGFIARLQDTYKVLDDELRPAFQTLLNATGSITKAQAGLELALNVSAGTTKDLASVSAALAKGFSGQTTALSRLGAGLDKATLASNDMDAIMASLNAKFSGQAIGALDTYSKQMEALDVATANAKESIGKGLLDSLALLGGDNGIDTATKDMERFGVSIANSTYGLAKMLKTLKVPEIAGSLRELFNNRPLPEYFKFKAPVAAKSAAYSPTSMYFTIEQAERAKLVATIKKQNTIEKEKQKLTAAELAAKKKDAELEALKKKFDVDRINLQAALANSTDEAEKARIRSLITIMDEDENAAARRLADLETANINEMKMKLRAADTLAYLADEAMRAAAGLASIGNPGGYYGYTAASPSFVYGANSVPDLPADMSNAGDYAAPTDYGYTAANPSFTYGSGNPLYNITINTPLGSEDALTESVQRVMQKLNRFGDSSTFAGALG